MNESYESLTIPSFDINRYLILMNDVLNNPSILSKQNELPTLSSRIGFIKLFNNWLQTQTIESNLMNQNDIRIHNTFGEISLRFNRTIEFTRATVSIESTQGHLNILCETEDDSMQFSFSSVDPNGAIKSFYHYKCQNMVMKLIILKPK